MGNDLDLAVALLGDLDNIAQVADAALNLDLLVQKLLKGRNIEDLVAGGLRSVDDELLGSLARLSLLLNNITKFDLSLLLHAIVSLAWGPGRGERDWASSKAVGSCTHGLRSHCC